MNPNASILSVNFLNNDFFYELKTFLFCLNFLLFEFPQWLCLMTLFSILGISSWLQANTLMCLIGRSFKAFYVGGDILVLILIVAPAPFRYRPNNSNNSLALTCYNPHSACASNLRMRCISGGSATLVMVLLLISKHKNFLLLPPIHSSPKLTTTHLTLLPPHLWLGTLSSNNKPK